MSDDKTTTVPGQTHDNAVLLLEAAQSLDLDPSVVKTSDGGFIVPAEVAKKAGFDENGEPTSKGAKEAAENESDSAGKSTVTSASSGLPPHDDEADSQGAESQQASKSQQSSKTAKKSGE